MMYPNLKIELMFMRICERCKKTGCKKYCVCKNVMYCDKECQKQDWKIHKSSCNR